MLSYHFFLNSFQQHTSLKTFQVFKRFFLSSILQVMQHHIAKGEMSQPAFTCSNLTIETLKQRCGICSKLTIKTPKRRKWRRFGVFIVNFEHISHLCSIVSIIYFEHVIAGWGLVPKKMS